MEFMDEQRSFWELDPALRMPKAFLMSGKRREAVEILYTEEKEHESDDSPMSNSESDVSDADDYQQHSRKQTTHFNSSAGSAFSKIGKPDNETESPHSKYDHRIPITPTSATGSSGLYPGFYPSLFTYPFNPMTASSVTGSLPVSTGNPFSMSSLFPPTSPATSSDKKETDSPERNMFYYVDPRIPFTNYFLNLTKLLSNNGNKNCSATTPLGNMAGDECRADDREHPGSPEAKLKTPEKLDRNDFNRAKRPSPSASITDFPFKKELKIDVSPEKLHVPSFPDHHIGSSPFSNHLLHSAHQSNLMSLHSGGLFHPAMMPMSNSGGYRRFNPEKPPPVKKYKCDVCGKAFSRSNTLVTHKRIHTGDKPFKCEVCGRAFRQPGNLTRHRLTHTTVKPYVCPTCNKAFNRASNLHTHMRTHTSFKAFVCPYCGKGFHQKIDMKIHCYTHTAHGGRGDVPTV